MKRLINDEMMKSQKKMDVLQRAAMLEELVNSQMEMEPDWLSLLHIEQDESVAAMPITDPTPSLSELPSGFSLSEEELSLISEYKDGDKDDIMTRAARALFMASGADLSSLDARDYSDCGEWLQLNQTVISNLVTPTAKIVKGSGYELEDLIQEASLEVVKTWDRYDPAYRSIDVYCRYRIWKHMLSIRRNVHSKMRDISLTESADAVRLINSEFEETVGPVIWSSMVTESQTFEDCIATSEELDKALAEIKENKREVLLMIAEGYTQNEIAKAIGTSQSVVSYRMTEAKKALKQAIA